MDKTLLILTNSIIGLYSFRIEVVKALVDKGYKIVISCPDERGDRHLAFEEMGCRIVQIKFSRRGKNPFSDLKLMISYFKLIKETRPFVVLTYTIKPNVYGGMVCRLLGIPLIANVTGLGDAIENGGCMKRLALMLYKLGISKADALFFQNKSNFDFFVKNGFDTNKSILLPGSGVNLQWHQCQPYPKDGIIKFLYIGRLQKDKGAEEFFRMAEEVKRQYPNTEFGIVGWKEGNYEKTFDELVAKNIIVYHGHTTDIRPYYGEVHCTIMPSYHEGMSNVNLESAANGRPVITTNVSGCKETVDDNITGFLCSPKSAEDLIDKVTRFILLPYDTKRQMGLEARKKVEHEFDRNIVIKAYLEAISKIDK